MTLLQSILLGIVQGLTEFLPVSSSGHLAIFQNLLHVDTGDDLLFDVLLHIGTLLVVLIVFRKDILQLILEALGMLRDILVNIRIWAENRKAVSLTPYRRIIGTNYRKFVALIIVSTIPTGIIGVLGSKLISDASDELIVPGICLIITGILLLLSDKAEDKGKIPQDITYREGVIVGIAQGLATLPGLSRSGTTLFAELQCGFSRTFAVRYSFILSIPAILGAAILELKDLDTSAVSSSMAGIYLAGIIAAAVVGYLCIRFMLRVVREKKLRYFAFYCFVAGAAAIIGYFVL